MKKEKVKFTFITSPAIQAASMKAVAIASGVNMNDAVIAWDAAMKKEGTLSKRTIYNNMIFACAWLEFGKLGKLNPASIEAHHVSSWINAPDGTKLGTRKVRLSILRQFMDYCSACGWSIGNAARQVRKVNLAGLTHAMKEVRKKVPFSVSETLAMMTFTKAKGMTFWHKAITLSYITGLRLGDICQLEWACLDVYAKTLTVWTDKRDKRVVLPLPDDTVKMLTGANPGTLPPPTVSDYIFPDECAMMKGERRAQLSVQFSRLMKRLGLQGHTFHDLRYAYVADCERRGIPMPHIQESLGHSSPKMTEHYAKPGRKVVEIPLKNKKSTAVHDMDDAALDALLV